MTAGGQIRKAEQLIEVVKAFRRAPRDGLNHQTPLLIKNEIPSIGTCEVPEEKLVIPYIFAANRSGNTLEDAEASGIRIVESAVCDHCTCDRAALVCNRVSQSDYILGR